MHCYQSIVTKYLSATNTKSSQVKASCQAGSITISYDTDSNELAAHVKAFRALMEKIQVNGNDWSGEWFPGALPNNEGYVFVCTYGSGSITIDKPE